MNRHRAALLAPFAIAAAITLDLTGHPEASTLPLAAAAYALGFHNGYLYHKRILGDLLEQRRRKRI